ncbi:DUF3558 domain-containing protein [Nocardia wallacei]|uniref:DUF3558 domain-containing protein n=1 Tax=Nocardia wallacei TaxID=480035 RepID=A0A7G1KU51_9NOCA|nr:DUF3558 domain-containing protein [Nocardia wallacei]BCK58451.1 hypothetical protein NWFMUON74_62230 [Nocardia wallacei]
MKHANLGAYCVAIAAVAMLAAGCTSGQGASNESDTLSSSSLSPSAEATRQAPQPTLTAQALQPPEQHPAPGRTAVVFDPCTWIPDDSIVKAGFDPNSRTRGSDQTGVQTFLACRFSSQPRLLTVMSGNVTWDEDLQKNSSRSEPISVNGREAMWVHDPGIRRGCEIHMRTKVGFVDLLTTLTVDGAVQGLRPCDGLLEIATAIEPSIGKDN